MEFSRSRVRSLVWYHATAVLLCSLQLVAGAETEKERAVKLSDGSMTGILASAIIVILAVLAVVMRVLTPKWVQEDWRSVRR